MAHPMSYSRLLGFGLASVVLSELINMAFTPTLSNGILPFIVFLVIFIVLHSMNMLLSIFEGIVQGARLDFVEVFSKFYMGNGVKFKPYRFKRHYTKD
jgi:V/A-type H+-transporting ATPase subunit I